MDIPVARLETTASEDVALSGQTTPFKSSLDSLFALRMRRSFLGRRSDLIHGGFPTKSALVSFRNSKPMRPEVSFQMARLCRGFTA